MKVVKKEVSLVSLEDMPRYRELMNIMLAEVVKGSPLLNHTDKTQIALTISRIAYGAVICESDPMGQRE